jgi:hypothetical protein
VDNIQHSVIHRLPQSYRWSSGFSGMRVEPVPPPASDEDNSLIGLRLLSHEGAIAWQLMHFLSMSLQDIQVDSTILECEGEPWLFIRQYDESAALCRLKNIGAAIAESVSASYPL